MRTFELEDLTLFLIRDADEAEMWIDRWAVSYPVVQTAAASSDQSIAQWQALFSVMRKPIGWKIYLQKL